MPKPGRQGHTPSEEIAHFTDREEQQAVFRKHLYSKDEPPVLVFYGVGGAGKTWLLEKLRHAIPPDTPYARLDFDRAKGGMRYVFDPAAGLRSMRDQLLKDAPHFDLAYGVMRLKQGGQEESGSLNDLAAEVMGASFALPGVGLLYKQLSKPVLERLRATPMEDFLIKVTGRQFAQELRTKTDQEIGAELPRYLAEDLRALLPEHADRTASCVLFLDTFEAIASEARTDAHRLQYEQWVRDIAADFDFALTVIAGQNRVTWEDLDPAWKDSLDQHLVGGLSASDARLFLDRCGLDDGPLQDAILHTAKEEGGGHHCFSLGLLIDIVYAERSRGRQPTPESLRFAPQSWDKLAHRFLKALGSEQWASSIEKLALTPRFDKAACLKASAGQDALWKALGRYSFVERLPGEGGWFSVRTLMRRALANRPSALERVADDHKMWREYWASRSASPVSEEASLAWYHHYCLAPQAALDAWNGLAEAARTAVPARMGEHLRLLAWWDLGNLLNSSDMSAEATSARYYLGNELQRASLGSRSSNLQRAIGYYEAALNVCTEQNLPKHWATTQTHLGLAWSSVPTGSRGENLHRAIACYEEALRKYTEQAFPQEWAILQK